MLREATKLKADFNKVKEQLKEVKSEFEKEIKSLKSKV